MDMDVDQPGNDPASTKVDADIRRSRRTRSSNTPVLDDNRPRLEMSVAPDMRMGIESLHNKFELRKFRPTSFDIRIATGIAGSGERKKNRATEKQLP